MQFNRCSIPDVFEIVPVVHGDHRGFFLETWRLETFKAQGISYDFVQDNQSMSLQGALRGLHYQIVNPQGKLIRVTKGEIFDVAVDLRKSSAYFRKWVGVNLSESNRKMVWVPPGFAHGFYVISETAEVCYKSTDYYYPEHERVISWNDMDLSIDWPLVNEEPPVLSAKDSRGLSLDKAETFP